MRNEIKCKFFCENRFRSKKETSFWEMIERDQFMISQKYAIVRRNVLKFCGL